MALSEWIPDTLREDYPEFHRLRYFRQLFALAECGSMGLYVSVL